MNIELLISFSAGVISVLSPCVLPLIPIVIGYSLLKKKTSEILSFVLGFFILFTLIIIFTVVFTAAVNHYIFYFRLIAAIIIILIGIFILLTDKSFNLSYRPVKHRNKLIGSFSMGFLTSLAWSPCYGAYLIALITYSASTGNIIYSAFNLIMFTAGFSITIFIMAFLASKIDLSRIIKHSNNIRFISGIVILIAGIYMFSLLL